MGKKEKAGLEDAQLQCPLCGHKFSCKKEEEGCEGCPLRGKTCKTISCPNCGYEIPILK